MVRKIHNLIFLFLLCVILTGCATSRSEITVGESIESVAQPPSGQEVVLRLVEDNRAFQVAPSNPSIPSLDPSEASDDDIKARAIARKRNTYGRALGDVLLKEGHTVVSLVREHLTSAFREAGYRVVEKNEETLSDLEVDVHIQEFWSWFRPGFWAIKLQTNIATELDFSNQPEPIVVKTHVEESRQMATESAWTEIIDKALLQYREDVIKALSEKKENQ